MMDKVRLIGRTVLYFPRAGEPPVPALITRVPPIAGANGRRWLDLTVFPPGGAPYTRERVPQAPREAERALAALADAEVPNVQDQWCWHPDDAQQQQEQEDGDG